MIFCLLLVNLMSGGGKLDNLSKVEFPETSNPYHVEIDEAFLSSLFPSSPVSSAFPPPFPDQTGEEGDGSGGDTRALPILPGFEEENRHKDLPRYKMRPHKLAQVDLASFPEDVIEFIDLCERGIRQPRAVHDHDWAHQRACRPRPWSHRERNGQSAPRSTQI